MSFLGGKEGRDENKKSICKLDFSTKGLVVKYLSKWIYCRDRSPDLTGIKGVFAAELV